MTQRHPCVFGGVDTHKHTHVAAVLDAAGRRLGTAAFDADTAGYAALLEWLRGHGSVERVGVEGTGSYGAGLARSLAAADVDVVDAEAAARAALNGDAAVVPKSADGCVEAIRTLSVARRSAVKARTVAANQIDAVVVTAPEHLKDRLRALNTARTVEACARLRHPGTDSGPVLAAAKQALRSLARRHQALTAEIKHLDAELRRLCERVNPALCWALAASFAALCGTSPIEASSGPIVRHRLNRGGNRHANNALWRIAMVRLRVDERSIAYAARLTAKGKTRREILRCLKRHIAREVYKLITDPPDIVSGADLRRQRTRQGLTIRCTAQALGAAPNRISELERGIIHNSSLAERYQRHLAANPS